MAGGCSRRPAWRRGSSLCPQTPLPEAPGAVHMSQTLPSDSPAVTALCVAHRWEMRLQSRSRSARALARPVGMAGRPFPPKPPGISCPSGCCSPAFSPRGPEGAGAGGLEGTRGGGPGKGRSSSPDTVRPGVGAWLGRDPAPESGAACTRGLGPTEAHRLPVVRLGVRSPARPQGASGLCPSSALYPGQPAAPLWERAAV